MLLRLRPRYFGLNLSLSILATFLSCLFPLLPVRCAQICRRLPSDIDYCVVCERQIKERVRYLIRINTNEHRLVELEKSLPEPGVSTRRRRIASSSDIKRDFVTLRSIAAVSDGGLKSAFRSSTTNRLVCVVNLMSSAFCIDKVSTSHHEHALHSPRQTRTPVHSTSSVSSVSFRS